MNVSSNDMTSRPLGAALVIAFLIFWDFVLLLSFAGRSSGQDWGMAWTAMRRPLIGWTAGISIVIAISLASGSPPNHSAADVIEGGAVMLLFVITAIVSWHALPEPTRRAIKRLFDD